MLLILLETKAFYQCPFSCIINWDSTISRTIGDQALPTITTCPSSRPTSPTGQPSSQPSSSPARVQSVSPTIKPTRKTSKPTRRPRKRYVYRTHSPSKASKKTSIK